MQSATILEYILLENLEILILHFKKLTALK